MKQHHFTVVAVQHDDGEIETYLDDADSGIFPEGSVYDTDTEEWEDVADFEEDMLLAARVSALLGEVRG